MLIVVSYEWTLLVIAGKDIGQFLVIFNRGFNTVSKSGRAFIKTSQNLPKI